eukprot:gnl/TRDRNA2_/TRDRNA2_156704_c2_seq2.p1 gnl/TRDRNA2_/TRDRNA2_156704_c2~~gnl/TRDRNA2_/TRDRNA2_156704_c2_seq2.p1  ORF type:complete len:348 (+),score=54.65 gnl/TRDRNA2_/TRDRNA2_156704_c2_seq2:121-1044(+)
MWRVGSDDRTAARYKHVGDTDANRARAVFAWYGEFSQKLEHYDRFKARKFENHHGKPWYGDISNILAVKDRLKCRPFSWFIRRFSNIYESAGLVPREIFIIKEEQSGRCLRYHGPSGTSPNGHGRAVLAECQSLAIDHREFWHLGNMIPGTSDCCSGLRAWNTDQCLKEPGHQGSDAMHTGVCEISGRDSQQFWSMTATGELKRDDLCLDRDLSPGDCGVIRESGVRWIKVQAQEPIERTLYKRAQQEHPEYFKLLDKHSKSQEPEACKTAEGGCLMLFRGDGVEECLDTSMQFSAGVDHCALFFPQ